jgi:hypothetical protein
MQKTFNFSIISIFSEAWELFKKRPWLLIFLTLITIFLSNYSARSNFGSNGSASDYSLSASVALLSLIMLSVSMVVSLIVSAGFLKTLIRYVRGDNNTQIFDLFSVLDWRTLLQYAIFNLCYVVLMILGFLFFIVPGIYIAVKYMFGMSIIIDKNVNAIDAARLSGVMTQGIKMKLIGFGLFSMLVVLLGVIAFVVGLFAAVPVTYLASALLYVKALKFYEEASHKDVVADKQALA